MSGLLAAGAIGGTIEAAHADGTVGPCFGAADSSPVYSCTLSGQFSDASAVTVSVTDDVTNSDGTTQVEDVTANVTTLSCNDNNSGTLSVAASSMTGPTTLTDQIAPLPANIGDGTCSVSVTVTAAATQPTGDTLGEFSASLNYTSSANASASPTTTATTSTGSSVHPVKGYDSKCLSDKGNSGSNGAKVIIWSCGGSDQAENWTFSGGELKHGNKCLNDQANGGNRSKVILYSCNGASNEKWSELANGELKLSSHNGTLCVNDPGSSKANGTQMIVYNCNDSANEKWSLP